MKPDAEFLRSRDLLEGRLRHALLPRRVADFEPIAARIMKVKLTSSEVPFGAIFQLDDGDFLFVESFACAHEPFRTHRERMMHTFFNDGFILGLLPLA